MGCHFLLQGIFLPQESNLHLLHWQAGSLSWSHQGSSHHNIYICNTDGGNRMHKMLELQWQVNMGIFGLCRVTSLSHSARDWAWCSPKHIQCVCAKSLQSCPTVTSWTVVRQVPLSIGFSRQEYWSGLPFPPPGDLPDPGVEPISLTSPARADGFFTTSTTV